MKRWKAWALLGLMGLVACTAVTYPRIGQVALHEGARLEAGLRGFSVKTVQVQGMSYRMYEGGPAEKPTLVLLHGYSADKDVWPRFASGLMDAYHIVIPDMAGHGDTGYSEGVDCSVLAQADRVVALMDALGTRRFHVAGNSMGGHIAALLAAEHPDRILSLIAIDPAGITSPKPSRMVVMVQGGKNPFEVESPEQFKAFYAMTMAKPPYLPGFVMDGMAQQYQDRRVELAALFKQLYGRFPMEARLKDIQAPTLLIWGKQDALIDVSAVPVWQAGVKNIQVQLYDDLGHMPMLEAPSEVSDRVRAFLADL